VAVSPDSHSKYLITWYGRNADISNDKFEGCQHGGG